MAESRDQNDLVLTPRTFAWIKDKTKGQLIVNVGPMKATIGGSESLLVMDDSKQFLKETNDIQRAIQRYVDVPEGSYVILSNPSKDGKEPEPRRSNDMAELKIGERVNVPGPKSFPLWPEQVPQIIPGHQLQMNQYLVVRVVNEEAASKNWSSAIMKPQTADIQPTESKPRVVPKPSSLSVGQQIIIRGTDVSFYIPPTGLEVVPEPNGNFVREAVTLEQLEYCVLVDQSGKKRFEIGPKVVFPEPSESFITEKDDAKFRGTELTEISGLHIKVTAPYSESDGTERKVGDELFLTGKTTPIYFPRAEHAVVRYGEKDVHYATAIPKGEGRYVMNRLTGEITTALGAAMILPDPRTYVLVRRILTEKQVQRWFPGNLKAAQVNIELAAQAEALGASPNMNYLSSMDMGNVLMTGTYAAAAPAISKSSQYMARSASPQKLVGDEVKRSSTYSKPRTITLDTKYDGAVRVNVWTGYAVLVVDNSGNRRVVIGPNSVVLAFDEELTCLELSTGNPKNTDSLLETAYLRVLNNRVSDTVSAETADLVQVRVRLSYRVNFLEKDKEKWFNVDNYVKLMCDHERSKIRNMIKEIGIQHLHSSYIDRVRDTVLGKKENGKRAGSYYEENGMSIYDVEILRLEVENPTIGQLLVTAQIKTVEDSITINRKRKELEMLREQEQIVRSINLEKAETAQSVVNLAKETRRIELEAELDRIAGTVQANVQRFKAQEEELKLALAVHAQNQRIQNEKNELEAEAERARIDNRIAELKGQTQEFVDQMNAVTPQLVTAIQAFGDKALLERVSAAMSPLAILGGTSVIEALKRLLQGTGMEALATGLAQSFASRQQTVEIDRH